MKKSKEDSEQNQNPAFDGYHFFRMLRMLRMLRKFRVPYFLCFFCILGISFFFVDTPQLKKTVFADTLESGSYRIEFGNFNITAGEKSSASYTVTDTVGQTAAGQFGAYGTSDYFLGSGFQYIYQIGSFAFSISDLNLDLGLLQTGAFGTASNELEISTRGAGGFSVYGYQLHALRSSDGLADITATACDGGGCTITTAQPWTLTSVPGFGFSVSGTTAAPDFLSPTHFRPFADQELNQPAQTIMTSPNIANKETATVTYQAAITGYQAAGNYQTSIVYIAVPGY